MLYVWLNYENRFSDIYLPSEGKWSTSIAIPHSESGWDRDYYVSVRSLDGQCFISPPLDFHWSVNHSGTGELPLYSGARYQMETVDYKIGVICTEAEQSDTAFQKYTFPTGNVIRVGRGSECELRVDQEIRLISNLQGVFTLKDKGICTYTDDSKNGSYLNGMLLSRDSIQIHFGDIITLNTGIKLIFLGGMLAVNRIGSFSSISLDQIRPPEVANHLVSRRVPSIQIEFHRTPRFVQKPDDSEIHIESPMDKKQDTNTPLWLTLGPSATMVLPMMMGSALARSSNGGFLGPGIAMVGTASVLAVFWGLLNYRFRKQRFFTEEVARKEKYRLYISQAEQFLKELSEQEFRRLQETRPNVMECARFPQDSRYRLWERMPLHEDFLSVRLGLGDVPLPNEIKVDDIKLSIVDDPLRDEPFRLLETYQNIPDAPVTIDLRTEHILGILGDEIADSLAQSILLQLAALHSYHDVRIVVITDEGEHSQWTWARWLPHVFATEDRQLRMVVSEPDAIQDVLAHLDEVLLMRDELPASSQENEGTPLPHYVIFCTKPDLLDNKPVLRHILTKRMGMSMVLLGSSMDRLPKECQIVLDASKIAGTMYSADGSIHSVNYEFPNTSMLQIFSRMVAPLRLRDATESAAIPTIVSFLDIYGVRRAEELDVWRFWNENHIYEGIRAKIGLAAGSKPFVLDISDKCHGPHGLLAGTTGSGKSVALQSYLLSLALNYHPDQVRFILIDYKGGGMADALGGLPHVAGVIDNLQSSTTIQRALASIQGEIQRREQIFRNADVSSIDDYIRFTYDDPAEERLPHLIIIVDEFAELKADQPDFMKELISASRVGRSLGIHLILSTQKPSNSVSDEIWANSNFRICLRVQTRSDSMEMLRRPEAAYIKNRGRCYIQIGNDELFEQVQTSYSGMLYQPDELTEAELPHLLDNAGQFVSVRQQRSHSSQRQVTQMDVVIDQIRQTARAHGIPDSVPLWMDELPSTLFLAGVMGASVGDGIWNGPNTGEEIKALYGVADDVMFQKQFPVWLDLMAGQNHMIVGMTSTGKTTLIQTLIMSFASRYSPAALQMYVLSLSSRTLGCVAQLPHIGDIIYTDEADELRRLLRLLDQEDQRRRTMFAEASTDSFQEYNRARSSNGEAAVPAIIVFADRFAQITELLGDDDAFIDLLQRLVRESAARGIYFVVTAMRVNEIPYKIRDCFRGIGLRTNDRADYVEIVGKRMPMEMPDLAPFAGRGIAQVDGRLYEIQVGLAGSSVSDVERANEISDFCNALDARWKGIRPSGIPRVPEHPTFETLAENEVYRKTLENPWELAFAYSTSTGLPLCIDLSKSYTFLITGARQSGKSDLLRLIGLIWSQRGARICAAADNAWSKFCEAHGIERFDDYKGKAWENYVSWLNNEIKRRNQIRKEAQGAGAAALNDAIQALEPVVILIDDLGDFIGKNPEVVNRLMADVAIHAAKYGIYLFAAVSHNAYPQVRMAEPVVSLARQQRGVALGGKLSDCDPWGIQMPFSKKSLSFPLGEAYLIDNGEVSRVIIPRAGEEV